MATAKWKPTTRGIVWRVILTIAVIIAINWINWMMETVSVAASGQFAGQQFNNSTSDFLSSELSRAFFGNLRISGLVGLVMLIAIWWRPFFASMKALKQLSLLAGALFFLAVPKPAFAYYQQTDYPEVYFIMPNESAFWVPDVGNNKDTQVKFGSEEYFKQNKIAAKRFNIPHVKLPSSSFFKDYYVPSGRLIIVDRTPYAREWVKSEARGTSKNDQSFPCQSNDGINITVGVAIGTSITEDESPTFLYHFGVNPPKGDRTQPEVVFTSVLHSRSLERVMDTVGHAKVQSLMCEEIGRLNFDEANNQQTSIMVKVRKDAINYFNGVGIHLDYIGYADSFDFDPAIQTAINERFSADKIRPVLDVLKTKAAIDTATKWNGQLPTQVSGFWLMPTKIIDAVTSWFKPTPVTKTN